MGRPRVKIIDDSQPQESQPRLNRGQVARVPPEARLAKGGKSQEKKPAKKEADSLVAKLKEELGIEAKPQPENTSEVKSEVTTVDTSEVNKEPVKIATSSPAASPRNDKGKYPKKPGKAKPRSKKYLEASKDLDRNKFYPISEALDMVKKMSYSKFNDGFGTLEAHINTYATGLRGLISLPYAQVKKIRILAFGNGAESSGADIFGDDSTIDSIQKGKIDFDILITTPEWMPKLTKAAKFLGPKGLMPNLKNHTITDDLKKAVENFQGGKTEFKTESKAKVIHISMGKLNQPNEELSANINTLLQTLGKSKVSKVTLSPTMGAGVKLDLASI